MATLKGAFLSFDAGLLGGLPNIVIFQMNPERVSRTPRLATPTRPNDGSGARNERAVPGEPTEAYSFSLRLDATDQLADSNPIAAASGILPALSALELLMQPKPNKPLDLFALAGVSSSQFSHPATEVPIVLLFWGPFRIWPVKISSLSINETAYDTLLNPIRAEVTVGLDVLTPLQLKGQDLAKAAYTYSDGVRQVMAALNLANAAQLGVSAALSFSV